MSYPRKDIQQRHPDISWHILAYPLNIHIFYPKRYLFKLTWIYPCLSFIILIVYPNHISMFISRKYIHIYPCLSTCIHKNILSYPHYISKRISAKYNHTYPCISMHIHADISCVDEAERPPMWRNGPNGRPRGRRGRRTAGRGGSAGLSHL